MFFTSFKVYDEAVLYGGYHAALNANGAQTRIPGRYDQFIRVFKPDGTDDGSLNSKCNSYASFGKALVSGDGLTLRFVNPSESVDVKLYTPAVYSGASSVSHLERSSLDTDCTEMGIPIAQCSRLMTRGRFSGEITRDIGENTLRIMRSILSSARNVGGKCTSNHLDWVI